MGVRPILQSMVEDISFDDLPSTWSMLDTVNFSRSKKLWDFQQEALKNAIKVLYLYFVEDKADKKKFYQRYRLNGLDEDLEEALDIRLSRVKREISSVLQQYYPVEDDRVKFYNFINRAAFWMATGSGKTLLIVKLVEALRELMEHKEIPRRDILILTHRDDLIAQLKRHVDEFNEFAINRGFKIRLVPLTEHDQVKRIRPLTDDVIVFYYRSDLISDEEKEKLIDYRNYENNGNWYIILDEAHKGDKEESKRQMYYSIMSRNGFLFNFSATFTDPRDIVTTAYNFNLERFISEGYGKHIYILRQEVRAFKKNEDYNRYEKQKIVLKSLILLTYLKKTREKIREIVGKVYHEPLMLVLVNTVNLGSIGREKPDLTLFFEELERIGRGDLEGEVFEEAKEELLREFSENPKLVYEEEEVTVDSGLLRSIGIRDVLRYVYNSESFGATEAILVPGGKKEAVFKLKTSDRPYALIKIGDAFKWVKENLKGYEVTESYEDKSIFENLDEREDISILMGSRAFYEGWDSNRPNIILFINIGVGTDAKKFIIQSVGRGVRIEPIRGKRRRLRILYNQGEDDELYPKIHRYIDPIETLFIFGTNRKALSEVITTLKVQARTSKRLELSVNEEAKDKLLLIPVYKESPRKLYQERAPQKFVLSENAFSLVREYFTTTDDRVLIIRHDLTPSLLQHIRKSFEEKDNYYKIVSRNTNLPLDLLVQKLVAHFNLNTKEFDRLKPLGDEIVHFKRIQILLSDEEEVKELLEKIENVKKAGEAPSIDELLEKFNRGEISQNKLKSELEKLRGLRKEERFKDLKIKYVPRHYYVPLILSEKEKIDYIKHVIKTRSEVKFIEDLENYLEKHGGKIDVDWWMFSKIDEHLDEVYIPYYDPDTNRIRKFKPDFIFWFQKGDKYYIVFVDPKGIKHTEYEHKVDWFRRYFEENGHPKTFNYETNSEKRTLNVKVYLILYTEDVNKLSKEYKKYWFDNISKIFETIRG